MRYFIDTEFIEGFHKPLFGKRRHFIDLISIGIVAEDGREYYAISSEYDYHKADPWVKNNVILPLYEETVVGDNRNHFDADKFHKFYGKPNELIAEEIKDFIYGTSGINNPDKIANWDEVKHLLPVEFYAYYADYDWVVFCSLFGRMIDLPRGFPMYCRDLKQTLDEVADNLTQMDLTTHLFKGTGWEAQSEVSRSVIDISAYTKDMKLELVKSQNGYPKQSNEHNALADARWNFELHKFLTR